MTFMISTGDGNLSLDSSVTIKVPLGGENTDCNPTDRGKLGTKRHILTDKTVFHYHQL
jgi:hypothetical protein